jgi:hypothetical protein
MTVAAVQPKGNGETAKTALAKPSMSMGDNGLMPRTLEDAWWYSQRLANSQFVPENYRGKVDDCLVALDMALRLHVHPLAFLQNAYIVHGKPGLEAKLVITLINQSGLFTDPLDYEVVGEDPTNKDYKVRAFATRKATSKVLYGPWITWKIVTGEGWDKKTGTKWTTMPEVMFHYRAASWFANQHCPEVKMGMMTTDELSDIGERKQVESRELQPTNGRQPFGFVGDGQEQAQAQPQDPQGTIIDPGTPDDIATMQPQPSTEPPVKLLTEDAPDTIDSQSVTLPPAEDAPKPDAPAGHFRCDNPKCQAEFTEPVTKKVGNETIEMCPHCDGMEMTTAQGEWKPTVECVKCHRQYLGKPVQCTCGSKLGWKSLNGKGGKGK